MDIVQPQVMSHMADYAWAPLFAALDKTHQSLIPKKIKSKLSKFQGEHTFQASAYYPPFDTVSRNITTWLSEDLTIGAESYKEIAIGGPSQSQGSFNPAVVQWNTGHEVAFISVSFPPLISSSRTITDISHSSTRPRRPSMQRSSPTSSLCPTPKAAPAPSSPSSLLPSRRSALSQAGKTSKASTSPSRVMSTPHMNSALLVATVVPIRQSAILSSGTLRILCPVDSRACHRLSLTLSSHDRVVLGLEKGASWYN